MLTLSLEGQAELSERFGAMPDQLRAALKEKVDVLAQDLFGQVVGVNLSGGVLNARSGALRDSIALQATEQDSQIGAQVLSDGDIPYAAIQEYGGKTAAHEILPDKTKALVFVMKGKQVFARKIEHPGSQIPERSYLRAALENQCDEIAQGLAGVVFDTCGNLEKTSS
jgi:phage gpG-like protein